MLRSSGGPATSVRMLLSQRQYLLLLGGNTLMFFGFSASILLRSVLAWKLTSDEMALAMINLVTAICMFCSSILSGVAIDRYERKRIMMIAQLVVLITESSALTLIVLGQMTFPLLLVLAVFSSSSFPFIMPTRTAMMVDAVERHALGKASALMSGGFNIARMVSPALAGFIAESAGLAYAYATLVSFHVLTLVCTSLLHTSQPTSSASSHYFKATVEGFTYLLSNKPLAMCFVFGLIPTLIIIPLQNLLIIFVDEIWHAGAAGLGTMMTAMGLGGILGSLLMMRVRDGQLYRPLLMSALAMCCFIVAFSNTPPFYLAVGMMLCISGSSSLTQILVNTATQLLADDHVRGRVTSISLMTFGLAPLGTIPIALMAKKIGIANAMTVAGTLAFIGVVLFWRFAPALRKIDQPTAIADHQPT